MTFLQVSDELAAKLLNLIQRSTIKIQPFRTTHS